MKVTGKLPRGGVLITTLGPGQAFLYNDKSFMVGKTGASQSLWAINLETGIMQSMLYFGGMYGELLHDAEVRIAP